MSTAPPGSRLPKGGSPKNRIPIYIGGGVAALAAYYLYKAGGNVDAAKKGMEGRYPCPHPPSATDWADKGDWMRAGDASQASSKVRQAMHRGNKQVGGPAEEAMARAGSAIDSTARDSTSILVEGQQKLGEAKDEAGKAIMSGIDSADIKVEHQASKAKGGVKSWFGW